MCDCHNNKILLYKCKDNKDKEYSEYCKHRVYFELDNKLMYINPSIDIINSMESMHYTLEQFNEGKKSGLFQLI